MVSIGRIGETQLTDWNGDSTWWRLVIPDELRQAWCAWFRAHGLDSEHAARSPIAGVARTRRKHYGPR